MKFLLSLIIMLAPLRGYSSTLNSDLFTLTEEGYCKVNLTDKSKTGMSWTATNASLDDVDFYGAAYINPAIMSKFAAGPRETLGEAKTYSTGRLNGWTTRFKNGHPHGGLTVYSDEKKIGHLVAGGGEGPGVSEVALWLIPDYHGQGLGTSMLNAVVNVWAPEVKRLGETHETFRCFGGQALQQLDATASPSNPASWVPLKKVGFTDAHNKVEHEDPVACFDGKDFDHEGRDKKHDLFEETLLALYTDKTALDAPLIAATRYHVIDCDGERFTMSKHERFNRMKYHFEYTLPQ